MISPDFLMASPGVFFFFFFYFLKIFVLWVCWGEGDKKAKNGPKVENILSVALHNKVK